MNAAIKKAASAVIEAATEQCFGGGPHDDRLVRAVVDYLRACGDAEMADDLALEHFPEVLATPPQEGTSHDR